MISLIVIASLVAVTVARTAPKFPKKYFVVGEFSTPYFNINIPVTAWTDEIADMQRVDYYGGQDTYLYRYDEELAFEIVPKLDQKVCFATNVTGPALEYGFAGGVGDKKPKPQVLPLVPDISQWTYVGQKTINNIKCDAFENKVTNVTTFGTFVNTYTMYVDGNNKPVQLHMYGIDFIQGSHPDTYIFNYYQFEERTSLAAADFAIPAMCKQNNQANTGLKQLRTHYRLMGVHQQLGQVFPPMHHLNDCEHDHAPEFIDFTVSHKKFYSSCAEHAHRQRQYSSNARFVKYHNKREDKTHTVALNKFADMSDDEYRQLVLLPRDGKARQFAHSKATHAHPQPTKEDMKSMPKSLDWRKHGAVTQVKDQNFCGSCFVFGSIGSLEGHQKIKNGKLLDIGEQQGVDCSWGYFGNAACDGGFAPGVFENLKDMGGVALEAHYPYTGLDGWCNRNDHTSGVQVTGYVNVTGIPQMYSALNKGPVAIAIDASLPSFRFYAKGVYTDPACGNKPENLDHEVLAVGYGQEKDASGTEQPVWYVKNSWSTTWGNQGYVNMLVTGNPCGVTSQGTYPLVK